MIMNVMRKLPFGDDKKEVFNVERVFMDTKGFHVILATDKGENFYFNHMSEKIKYLSKTKGMVITSISWNEDAGEDSTKVLLFF